MSSVGEGASLAAAVITDGLATLAAVVLQKNIFVISCGQCSGTYKCEKV